MNLLKFFTAFLLLLAAFSCKNQATEKKAYDPAPDLEPYQNYSLSIDERVDDLISRLTLDEKAKQMINAAEAIPRLDIPEYNWWNECLHGVARSGRATVFPQPIGMAATFDPGLIFRVATAISDEARAIHNVAIGRGDRSQYKGLTFWTPNVNIFRDPRWGRGQETYGEDPFLSGALGAAFVKGLQGDDPHYMKAAACAKHYAVHSGPEGLRHHFNAVVSDKDLYETYLPAFKALVDADVEIVMCAYNRTNGKPCCGSETLLMQILRDDWGFNGHVVSDCGAIADIYKNHKYTKTPEESVALAIKNQVNLNCGSVYKCIPSAVEQGLLTETEVDEALRGLLRTRFKLGLMDPYELNPYNSIPVSVIHSDAHKLLSRETARKSVVLLKNKNNVLPLRKDLKKGVFVTGPMAGNIDVLIGNYYGPSDDLVTFYEGIVGKVDNGVTVFYKHGVLFNQENLNPADWSTGRAKVTGATIAVLGISGLIEGEEGESIASTARGDREDIGLPESQLNYLKKLRKVAPNKPIIVVLTGGSPIACPEVQELADAVLFAWYPGEQGGNAVADIIFGDAVPSGRLPVTFPVSLKQLPPYEDYSMVGRTYRYMEQAPLYPFGFGLSYTTFEYSNISLSKSEIEKGESVTAKVTITNTGSFEAEEVVQLYITDKEASFRVPLYSLKGIRKVALKQGESKEVVFGITENTMSSINDEGRAEIEPGEIIVYIGGSSPCQRSKELGVENIRQASIFIK